MRERDPLDEPAADAALLARYLAGEARAMDALVERHGALVYGFVRRTLGPGLDEQAQDVAQEAWLRALRGARGFDGRARFTTWLLSIARNACVDAQRARARRGRHEAAPDPPAGSAAFDPGPPVVDAVARRELGALVEEGLAALPGAQREALLLREGALSVDEIAALTGVPRDTVKSRVRYALAALRRFLRQRLGREVSARDL